MSKRRSLAVAKYILDRRKEAGDAVTPMQLIKLVYIAHGMMLGHCGRPLISEDVEAWQYGPVIPSVYDAVKDYRSNPIDSIKGAPSDFEFDQMEQKVMDVVAKHYGPLNGVRLSSSTHMSGTPWSITWESAGKNSPISSDLIEDHYDRVLKKTAKGL